MFFLLSLVHGWTDLNVSQTSWLAVIHHLGTYYLCETLGNITEDVGLSHSSGNTNTWAMLRMVRV